MTCSLIVVIRKKLVGISGEALENLRIAHMLSRFLCQTIVHEEGKLGLLESECDLEVGLSPESLNLPPPPARPQFCPGDNAIWKTCCKSARFSVAD